MPTIVIEVKNKIAKSPVERIVCGNSDFEIKFAFDEEWAAHNVKTARFAYNGTFEDIVFNGDVCGVPIIRNANVCMVGVFAGDLRTTTPALVACDKSILCADGVPADPQPDVYQQLLELINSGMLKGEKGEKGETGENGYTPVRGKDYWTQEDQETIVDEAIKSNQIQEVIKSVETAIDTAEKAGAIARGKATGYVFDTSEDMQLWLENEANKKLLNLGDNLYIRAINVPDYWWDGNAAQPLETQKVDLTEYMKKSDYTTEKWTFTMTDGSAVEKDVVVG